MKHRCIAISGKSGCGNTTISTLLARRMGYEHVNFTFRQLAEEHGMSLPELLALAAEDPRWDRELDRRQVELALERRSVVGSRLAIWLMADTALTVYLDAPLEVRAARIAAREGKSLALAMEETARRDEGDRERFLRVYHIDIDQHAFAHLHVDVSEPGVDAVVDSIMAGLPAGPWS